MGARHWNKHTSNWTFDHSWDQNNIYFFNFIFCRLLTKNNIKREKEKEGIVWTILEFICTTLLYYELLKKVSRADFLELHLPKENRGWYPLPVPSHPYSFSCLGHFFFQQFFFFYCVFFLFLGFREKPGQNAFSFVGNVSAFWSSMNFIRCCTCVIRYDTKKLYWGNNHIKDFYLFHWSI